MRINARLDDEHFSKLEALKNSGHQTTTEVIKKALDYYYDVKKNQNKTNINQLLKSDFIACGNAESDLSENYKSYLTNSLKQKNDID